MEHTSTGGASASSTKNIYLIGFMGVGKSTVAAALGTLCAIPVIEMDSEIEAREQMTIAEIFSEKGEHYFRRKETDLLAETLRGQNCIVSCGGGVVLQEENVRLMKGAGRIFYLTASPETILERVKRSDSRPLLAGRKNIADISKLMKERTAAYEKAADYLIDTDRKSAAEIAAEILEKF